ncbi:hypothetical protein D9757_009111 [Collybiopsis confluens]|uniref:Autophagy-related protein 13 n=1 Tax=Collybiopsis confluens TaxID=2823264 RepID=A0A8H5H934_9AGAR|nr:hypothetical protein D9757_009111 [Collybiopsis confluens]
MSDAQQKITFHFYTKLFYVVNDARASATVETGKTDKWFNLETPDSDSWTKEGREPYRSISDSRSLPPLEIQVLLTIPDTLANNQVLVYTAPDSSRTPIDSMYKFVLLERWVLNLNLNDSTTPSSPLPLSDSGSSSGGMTLPTLYKHGIPLFRSLYTLLRILPSWKLSKRFRNRRNGTGGLGMQVRVMGDPGSGVDNSAVMDFGTPLALPTTTHSFPPIQHPLGTFSLTGTYLSSPNFRIDERESLLSSRFMSMDTGMKGMEFTPTLVKNQQRDSMIGSSGGSLGTRSSLPRSPPRDIPQRTSHTHSHSRNPSDADSIAERFILPSGSAGASNPTLPSRPPSSGHPILPITRATTTSSTSTQPLVGFPARLRKQSLGRAAASDSYLPSVGGLAPTTQPLPFPTSSSHSSTSSVPGTSGTSPSSSSPMAVRRPGLNPVNPFKSKTLSGATTSTAGSSRVSNALGTGTGLSGSPLGYIGITTGAGSSSGLASLSSLSNLSNLPGTITGPSSNKPSPPSYASPSFAPSSLGAASTGTGTGTSVSSGSVPTGTGVALSAVTSGTATTTTTTTGEIAIPSRRKRYSSSFGHRYSSPARGGASAGSSSIGGGGSQGAGSTEGGMFVGSAGRRSIGSGSGGGSGTGVRGRESRHVSLANTPDPDMGLPLQDDHDDISSFMQDIDTRKPLMGRSRIYAQAQLGEGNEEEEERESSFQRERDRWDRDRDRYNERERERGRDDRQYGLARHRFSAEVMLFSTSPPSSAPPSPRSPRFTGPSSPPSSPLRNVIPLSAEEDEDGTATAAATELVPAAAATVASPSSPLSPSPFNTPHPSGNTTRQASSSSNRATPGPSAPSLPSSPPAHSSPMLTNALDVEARLKKMNDVFLASLQGLGSGSGSGSSNSGSGSGSGLGSDSSRVSALQSRAGAGRSSTFGRQSRSGAGASDG